jgi:hypothetical protein
MKESEKLLEESRQEDNDLKSYSIYLKSLREKRSEKFIDGWLKPLSIKYDVKEENYKYTITTQEYGIIDYFPKKNKLLIRKKNEWKEQGLKWIINNLFK